MTYEINLTDRQQLVALDGNRIRAAARDLLKCEQVASAAIGLIFVDDAVIRRLNREYLAHDYPTDVISFLLEEPLPPGYSGEQSDSPRGTGKHLEGEVVISTETAVAQAENYGWRTDEELLLYVVHGILHLAGYDDQTPDERSLMRRRETETLTRWGLTRPQDDMDEEPHSENAATPGLPREGLP